MVNTMNGQFDNAMGPIYSDSTGIRKVLEILRETPDQLREKYDADWRKYEELIDNMYNKVGEETAKRAIKLGMTDDVIRKLTNLPIDEITKLRNIRDE